MRKIYVCLGILILLICGKTDAQVTIAPPLVVMDRENPYGSYLVANRSNQVKEVTISFKYGYPVSDDEGNVSVQYIDAPDSSHRTAVEWVRAFPRRFVLEPMQEQTVRLLVRPRGEVQEGTYTARIITSSERADSEPGSFVNNDNEVSTRINFKFNQVSALMYRHGKVTTGVEIEDITTKHADDNLDVYASLRRQGNSPYIGSARLRIYNGENKVIKETSQSIAVYDEMVRRFRFAGDSIPPGDYTAELTLSTSGRSDVSSSVLIKAPDVTKTFTISI